jgi:hypothetical protein
MVGLSIGRANFWRYLLAGALTFVTSLTIGNDPNLFFGYGLSGFGMLTAGLILTAPQAAVVVLIASAAGMSLMAATHSAFTLVVVGAVLVRTLQAYALSRFKEKAGPAWASLGAVLLGTVVATLLGFAFYGGAALSTTMAFFDAAFVLPAWLLAKSVNEPKPGSSLLGVATILITFWVFLSASAFLVPVSALASIVLLGFATYFTLGGRLSKKASTVLLIVVLVAMPLTLATGPAALAYNTRNAFYPLYPDSISSSQWTQTNSSLACMQGNLAGAGTIQNGVWGPSRLRVLKTCVTVTGVVQGIFQSTGPSNDNDFSIDIKLDPQYSGLLAVTNLVLDGGLMHTEVVPSMQPHLEDVLSSLKPGERVTITGALILDTDHGFGSEIHPVWAIAVIP